MVSNLIDQTTETFWESSEDDKNKFKTIMIQCIHSYEIPKALYVHFDNCRDLNVSIFAGEFVIIIFYLYIKFISHRINHQLSYFPLVGQLNSLTKYEPSTSKLNSVVGSEFSLMVIRLYTCSIISKYLLVFLLLV